MQSTNFLILFFFVSYFQLAAQQADFKYPLPSGFNYVSIILSDSLREGYEDCRTIPLEFYEDTIDYLACVNDLSIDYFYPIGWSNGGAFAYATFIDVDGQLPNYELKVINSPMIGSPRCTSGCAVGVRPIEDYESLYDFWKEEEEVTDLLDLHEIRLKSIGFSPLKGLSVINGNDLGVELLPFRKNLPYNEVGTFIYEYQLKINAGQRNERLIYKYEYRGVPQKIKAVAVAGVFKSPYEQKAVVLLTFKEMIANGVDHISFKLIVVNW